MLGCVYIVVHPVGMSIYVYTEQRTKMIVCLYSYEEKSIYPVINWALKHPVALHWERERYDRKIKRVFLCCIEAVQIISRYILGGKKIFKYVIYVH